MFMCSGPPEATLTVPEARLLTEAVRLLAAAEPLVVMVPELVTVAAARVAPKGCEPKPIWIVPALVTPLVTVKVEVLVAPLMSTVTPAAISRLPAC